MNVNIFSEKYMPLFSLQKDPSTGMRPPLALSTSAKVSSRIQDQAQEREHQRSLQQTSILQYMRPGYVYIKLNECESDLSASLSYSAWNLFHFHPLIYFTF